LQKLGTYWNWDRSFQAEMIKNLNKHYPAAIVYDMQFFYPEDQNYAKRFNKLVDISKQNNPAIAFPQSLQDAVSSTINYDRQFIDATREAHNVFHALCMADKSDYSEHALSQIEPRTTMEWHDSLHPASAITLTREELKRIPYDKKAVIDGIFPPLAQAARDIGCVNIPKGKDGVIKEIPLLYPFGNTSSAYLPISIRTAATLFATPDSEIVFEPGKFVDIGKPFKIFKDGQGRLAFSYPNVTTEFVKALIDRGAEITSLQPGKSLDVSSLCSIGKDEKGQGFISMYCGNFGPEITQAFLKTDFKAVIGLPINGAMPLAPGIDDQTRLRGRLDAHRSHGRRGMDAFKNRFTNAFPTVRPGVFLACAQRVRTGVLFDERIEQKRPFGFVASRSSRPNPSRALRHALGGRRRHAARKQDGFRQRSSHTP
jgi:hypothetical protein